MSIHHRLDFFDFLPSHIAFLSNASLERTTDFLDRLIVLRRDVVKFRNVSFPQLR